MKKEIKILLIWHNLNSRNFGVGALSITQISMLHEAAENTGIGVLIDTAGTANNTDMTVKSEIERSLGITIQHKNISFKKLFLDFINPKTSVIKKFSNYDLVIDIGEGDSFTDIYGIKRFLLSLGTKLMSTYSGTPLILAPQTIGPFKRIINEKLAKWVMRRAKAVCVRDYKSAELVRRLGINPIELSDLAFSLPYQALPKIPSSVGINVSGLLWNKGYTGRDEFSLRVNYRDFILKIITGLLERGKKIYLISHVISRDFKVEDDYAASIEAKSHFLDNINVILAPEFKSPIEAKTYISQMEFFTGARMHATIAAISAGVITIPIAYSRKFSGVFETLDYQYTLEAFTLSEQALLDRFFLYHDDQQLEMQASLKISQAKAQIANKEYLLYLQDLLKNA